MKSCLTLHSTVRTVYILYMHFYNKINIYLYHTLSLQFTKEAEVLGSCLLLMFAIAFFGLGGRS